MADFSHIIKLTAEEVQQAILDLAFQKAKARGYAVDAHTFHTKAAVSLSAGPATPTASISWGDE